MQNISRNLILLLLNIHISTNSRIPKKLNKEPDADITVAVEVVVDSALHARLGGNTSATNSYVTTFWAAVNRRFRTTRVRLAVAGITISARGLEGTAGAGPGGRQLVRVDTALAGLARQYRAGPASAHLVVALTAHDLCRGGSRCNPATAGYAYVGGACRSGRAGYLGVALVEDTGGYSGVVVAAHEVAHLLGAGHDGEAGATACSPTSGYIMSDNRRTVRGLQWSSCTRRQLTTFLASPAAACLRSPHPAAAPAGPVPARAMTLDEQCRREAGPGSAACLVGGEGGVCTQLFCSAPGGSGCTSYRPALEGSSCGPARTCWDGFCIASLTNSTNKPNPQTIRDNRTKIRTKTEILRKTNTNTAPLTTIPASCHDKTSISVRGISNCNKLFRSFAFHYCGNKYVQNLCCASHALFCGV